MDPQQEQQRQPSAVDRANEAIGKARGVYRKYRRARTALTAARTAFTAARAGVAAVQATASAASNPAGIVVLIIVIIVLTFSIVIMGGGATTATSEEEGEFGPEEQVCANVGGTCKTNCAADENQENATCSVSTDLCCVPSAPDTGTSLTCPSEDYEACLKRQFNITVRGNPPKSHVEAYFNGIAKMGEYNTFLTLLKRANLTIVFSSYYTCTNDPDCPSDLHGAYARVSSYSGGVTMYLYRVVFDQSTRYQNYFYIHETAHVVGRVRWELATSLYYNTYLHSPRRDAECFNKYGIVKTYSLGLSDGRNLAGRESETWAESVADSVLCKDNATCPPNGGLAIEDFPDTCSFIYNYVNRVLD